MPALLPPCCNLFEVGCYTRDGDNIEKLLIDSPDGLIVKEHYYDAGRTCCLEEAHENSDDRISIEVKSPFPDPEKIPVQYTVPLYYVLQILIHMAVTNADSNWFVSCGPRSVVLIQCNFDEDLWRSVWQKIQEFLDKPKPVMKDWMPTIVDDLKEPLKQYVDERTHLVGEVPIVHTTENKSKFFVSNPFSPYHITPSVTKRQGLSIDEITASLHVTHDKSITLLKDAHHIVREEASEIIAFVGADTTRIHKPGIPSHIPMAYGLKGYSLPMSTMRKMISHLRDHCSDYNINVRCEVYDGQFLNLVRFNNEGSPLTRLSYLQHFFKEIQRWTKLECANFIVNEALPQKMEVDIKITDVDVRVWQQHCVELLKRKQRRLARPKDVLDADDINKLLKGSKLGTRLSRRAATASTGIAPPQDGSDNDSDEDTEDGDYLVDDELMLASSDEESDADVPSEDDDNFSDLESELDDIVSDAQDSAPEAPEPPSASETTFLQEVLHELRNLGKGKIDWTHKTIDDLVNDFLKRPASCMKLLHDELNIINRLIFDYTAIKVFNVSDRKAVKINKLITGMKTSRQTIARSTHKRRYKVKRLTQCVRSVLLKPEYPKTFLHIIVARTIFERNFTSWLSKSTVPMIVEVPQKEGPPLVHDCYCYPAYSRRRSQNEFRCIDPGHTLANMRSQISRHGFDFCSKEAFVRASESNHDVLPKSILNDQLDKQSIRIAKRFFSVDVEKVLLDNGDEKEAKFVGLVRNWFEACDARGIDIYTRMKSLYDMYEFLTDLVDWNSVPPPSQYIQGMPIPTYECLMQGISTRMQFFSLCDIPINQRSISTLGVESFFGHLTEMEFSGLGCPKAVDVPKLISHVTELNNIRHNAARGFAFHTTNRAAYPYHTLDMPSDDRMTTFDLPRKRKQRKAQTLLALPKAITRGQLSVREHHRKDESKVLLHKRAGVPDSFDANDPS